MVRVIDIPRRAHGFKKLRILCLECGMQAYIGIPMDEPEDQFGCGYCESFMVKIEPSMVGLVPPVETEKRN